MHGCLSAVGLRGGNGVESFENGVVNGAAIVEEDPYDLLDKLLGRSSERRRGVWSRRELDFTIATVVLRMLLVLSGRRSCRACQKQMKSTYIQRRVPME